MKKRTMLLAGIIAVIGQGAFAALPSMETNEAEVKQLTPEQELQMIEKLLEAGVIEIVDGKFVVRDQSALNQLWERGRVSTQFASDSSICY